MADIMADVMADVMADQRFVNKTIQNRLLVEHIAILVQFAEL